MPQVPCSSFRRLRSCHMDASSRHPLVWVVDLVDLVDHFFGQYVGIVLINFRNVYDTLYRSGAKVIHQVHQIHRHGICAALGMCSTHPNFDETPKGGQQAPSRALDTIRRPA
jgi:hypothetical protein